MDDVLPGKTLGHYTIQSLIGEGSMGAVYKALDITLQRIVAVKVMHPNMVRQKTIQDRFIQEASTAALLSHPGIIKVFDFGQSEENLYIVMEFIPGDNLAQLLQDMAGSGKQFILTEAIRLVQLVAFAMHYAHQKGVLHRDIKPGNILLKPEEAEGLPYRPIITDLGLSKLVEGGVITTNGSSMGKPAYMSPEQALGESLDIRSDVYSLGILLYELCTGHLPFAAKTISEAIKYHTKEAPPPPHTLRPDLPQKVEDVILKALQKDPKDRFQDALSFASALKNTLDEALAVTIAPDLTISTDNQSTQIQKDQTEVVPPTQGENYIPDEIQSQDVIKVFADNKPTFSFSVNKKLVTIGREADNDIIIEDERASRYHARIEFDGQQYHIIDLNSANGAYLDDTRLLPDVSEIWAPENTLIIGDTWLKLFRRELPAAVNPIGAQVEDSNSPSTSQNSGVAIFIDHSEITVIPGNRVSFAVTLLNQSQLIQHFQLIISGIPDNWIVSPPDIVQVMPGVQQITTITLEPPRNAKGRAGKYMLSVTATSNEAPNVTSQAGCMLEVPPFSAFNSYLTPQKVNNNRQIRVNIENQGNTAEDFQIVCLERSGEVYFSPPNVRLNIPAGQVGAARFRGNPRQKKFIGSSQTYQYSVDIESASGQSQSQPAEIVCRPIIPLWLVPVVVILCCLVFGGAGMGYISYQSVIKTAQARAVAQTATYVANLQSFQSQTQAALESTNATSTALAVIAQAAGDNDSDGLSNTQEISLGTDPNNPDTDNDDLVDGLEINLFGTNPKNQDSDGDTLADGREVNELKTSPTNIDTDGDGINDNVDSEPLQLPTATISPTGAIEPTGTVGPTRTAWKVCPDSVYLTRLSVGMEAFVSPDPPLANRLRSSPNTGGEILGSIQPNEHVKILEGPQCANKWVWWKVQSLKTNLVGWTSEGDEAGYWLVPVP